MQAWWGLCWQRLGLVKAASIGSNNRRRIVWHADSTAPCCRESCGRRSLGPPTVRCGRCLLKGGACTKTGRLVADILQYKYPYMCVPPVENSMCSVFKEYEEVLETVPFDLF